MKVEDLTDDEVIQTAFETLNDKEMYDAVADFADDIYMNGTIKERGLLASYMQGALEEHRED